MLFPKTVAYGEAFCNRTAEKEILENTILQVQHSVVVSPRRYGKTSLILKVIDEIKWPYAHIDLFLAVEEQKIVERFLEGIAKLVAQVVPLNVKALARIKDFFKSFNISVNVGNVELGLKIESAHPNKSVTIKNALENLEDLLKKNKKKAIIFIDEMQDIVQTPICGEVEAILRFYAQKTKNLAFIFSGSNRKLLKEIFDDRARPLFKMCGRLNLRRMKPEHYQSFLNHAALKQWNANLSQESLVKIFELTELHPYYINYLCSHLWCLEKPPTFDQVDSIWEQISNEEVSSIAQDIDQLSINQKKLLSYIAQIGILKNPTALEHQKNIKLTARGTLQSLKGLIEKDIVERIPEGTRVTDPMLKYILLKWDCDRANRPRYAKLS